MKRSAPLQRTAWKRQEQPKGEERPARIPPVVKPLTRPPVYWKPANEPVLALPKTKAFRSRVLLDLARGMPCLLRVPGVCNDDRTTTVACHSNLLRHGKGAGRKADDSYSVWGCARCHTWLDSSYSASYEERVTLFAVALDRQREYWERLEQDRSRTAGERAAIKYALARLVGPSRR